MDKDDKGYFSKFLGEIGTTLKSLGPDEPDPDETEEDKAIRMAAEGDGKGKGKKRRDMDDEDDVMGKSFTVTLENGQETEAFDATRILKSLVNENMQLKEAAIGTGAIVKALATRSIEDAKTLKALTTAVETAKADYEALKKSFDALAEAGKGRKSATIILPKVEGKGEQHIDGKTFMAKALTAQAKGLISGSDVAQSEARLNRNIKPDQRVIDAVLAI